MCLNKKKHASICFAINYNTVVPSIPDVYQLTKYGNYLRKTDSHSLWASAQDVSIFTDGMKDIAGIVMGKHIFHLFTDNKIEYAVIKNRYHLYCNY